MSQSKILEAETISIFTSVQSVKGGHVLILEKVNEVLNQSLQLGDRAYGFTEATRLLGDLPELDSMAVLTVLTAIEEQFGIVIDDDDISADTFETVGSLVAMVLKKLD